MPVFLCLLRSLDLEQTDPPCRLADQEGEVGGSLHRSLVEAWGHLLLPGAVLLLRSPSLLLTGRQQYVSVTQDNMVAVYRGEQVRSCSCFFYNFYFSYYCSFSRCTGWKD